MLKIILVRHAKALDRNKAFAKGITDKNRPLTSKGVREFKKHIKNNKKVFNNVELFVTSPYLRAIETLDVLLEALALESVPILKISGITPDDNINYLLNWIKKRKEKKIVIVSHEPFLSHFLNDVLNSVKSFDKFNSLIKKGAVIVISYSLKSHRFKLTSFKNPVKHND